MKRFVAHGRPHSINQYSNMAPRLSDQNCKLFKFLLSLSSQKRLGYEENNTKYRSFSLKPRSHARILIYRAWPIAHCRNMRGLGRVWLFSVCLKNQDIQMKDGLNLRVLSKIKSILRRKMVK